MNPLIVGRKFEDWLKEMPTTSWTIFTGTLVGMGTCTIYLATMLMEIGIEPVTFGIWCGFVASWIGFGVRQFRVKRETDANLSPAARDVASGRLSVTLPKVPS